MAGQGTAEQAAQVRAEASQFGAQADDDTWEQAWDARSTYDDAPVFGWFLA
ncbi:hypothetical protein [Micromonospora profundi]|uniref:hypothetical protein n=1 Tax=Micromonospora TaxID=1873 RepID=UPI0033ADCEB1